MIEIALFWASAYHVCAQAWLGTAEVLDAMEDRQSDWIADFVNSAREAGHIQMPFCPSDDRIKQIAGLFGAGLSPVETVNVLFGRLH